MHYLHPWPAAAWVPCRCPDSQRVGAFFSRCSTACSCTEICDSGNGRYYRVVAEDLAPGLFRQARYYLWGIFVGSPHPYPHSEARKFNPTAENVLPGGDVPAVSNTDCDWMGPTLSRINCPTAMFGVPGIGLWALAHTYTGYFLSLFMVVHIYLGTTGQRRAALFRLMWSGDAGRPEPPSTVRTPDLGDRPGSHDDAQVAARKERT